MLPSEIERNERGADVCHRVVKMAVENVKGDASKGFHHVDAYCNKPVVLSISEGRKMCPDCDKQPPVGNVHPRVTNAAGVKLTPAELKECGQNPDGTPINPPAQRTDAPKVEPVEAAVEAKVIVTRKDAVAIEVTLAEIEGTDDIAALVIRRVSEAMNELPVTNFGESKRLIKLQDRLELLLKV